MSSSAVAPSAASLSKNASYSAAGSSSTAAAGSKGGRRLSGNKQQHNPSRSYPRGVGLDFRKLPGLSLINYVDHHGMYPRAVIFLRNFS
jgi:hypothetical protein